MLFMGLEIIGKLNKGKMHLQSQIQSYISEYHDCRDIPWIRLTLIKKSDDTGVSNGQAGSGYYGREVIDYLFEKHANVKGCFASNRRYGTGAR